MSVSPRTLARVVATQAARSKARTTAQANPTNPWLAEPDVARRDRFTIRHRNGAESIIGDTADFLPVSFLAQGYRVGRAVALVMVGGPKRSGGTGFLIGSGLFITNHHVLPDVATAALSTIELGYEFDAFGRRQPSTRFALAPQDLFVTASEDGLDFTVVAVGVRLDGDGELADFGCCPLSDADDKHAIGMPVNIIQHPELLPRCVALRNNLLTARDEQVLLYETDTQVGSSGSPVLNDAWEVIALHHWGEPHLAHPTPAGETAQVNEGIRISAIVRDLRRQGDQLPPAAAARLAAALAPPAEQSSPTPRIHHGGERLDVAPAPAAPVILAPVLPVPLRPPEVAMSEPIRITIPLEVTIQLGQVGERSPAGEPARRPLVAKVGQKAVGIAAERLTIDEDFTNRSGYDPEFIAGHPVPLPRVRQTQEIAPVSGPGTDPATGELRYEHFSVVMHRSRRLALFTATTIDGAAYLEIERKTGRPSAEASERWATDPRLSSAEVEQDFYSAWSDWFDRGHLTRRSDPTWGTPEEAMRANADTFHFTNCTPQHWRFNESAEYWQGVERFILEKGGLPAQKRLVVFQGPVLDDGYADCDGVLVPLRFWKVVAWEGAHGLKATGFVVSQERIIDQPRRRQKPADDQTPLHVDEFRTAISRIARMTGLDFGPLAAADTRSGAIGAEELRLITDFSDLL